MFLGSHPLSLDVKGRLAFPVAERAEIEGLGGKVVITLHVPERCLRVYPMPVWTKLLRFYQNLPRKYDRFRRLILGHAAVLQLDSAGRVVIPQLLREAVGLERSVVLVGDVNRLEIWDLTEFKREQALTQSSELPEGLMDMMDPTGMADDDDLPPPDPSLGGLPLGGPSSGGLPSGGPSSGGLRSDDPSLRGLPTDVPAMPEDAGDSGDFGLPQELDD